MQSYALTEIRDRQNELLKQANAEPILLTAGSQPGYVILSAHHYQQLIDRLALLEDCALGQLAQTAIEQSPMLGTEAFTAELQQIAHSDSSAA